MHAVLNFLGRYHVKLNRHHAPPDGSGLDLRCRQIHSLHRPVPGARTTRFARGAIQTSEHGTQFGGTVDGGEIGRAQALQAIAAGVPPHIDFNPILLKLSSDKRTQVIIHGKAHSDLNARDYHEYKPRAMKAVLESWERLCATYDWVVIEGAGSRLKLIYAPVTLPTWALLRRPTAQSS